MVYKIQVADDSTWRENQNPAKFEEVSEMPAWGYRYKVRIIGQHEQEESDVSAEGLPLQVMYPVTAGSGHGGSFKHLPSNKVVLFLVSFLMERINKLQ